MSESNLEHFSPFHAQASTSDPHPPRILSLACPLLAATELRGCYRNTGHYPGIRFKGRKCRNLK